MTEKQEKLEKFKPPPTLPAFIFNYRDQIFTVSGYCFQSLKKVGDTVTQGEAIALVGSAGSLRGPCLHFEIRHRGKPQNPRKWIYHVDKVVSLSGENEKGSKEL
jgi:hypothetical protein